MKLRNWIEEALGKQIVWKPTHIGTRHGRNCYIIQFADGTEKDYFIDFERKEIEEVVY